MTQETAPTPLSQVERFLLLAARAWGGDDADSLWEVFASQRRVSYRWAWDNEPPPVASDAADRLQRIHQDQARPDFARVHPTWWARALADEPRSVRSVLVSTLPETVAATVRKELEREPGLESPDRLPDPDALNSARAWWRERIVGDVPPSDEDPPAIAALTAFDSTTVARFLRGASLAKWAISGADLPELSDADRARAGRLGGRLEDVPDGLRTLARAEVFPPGTTRATFDTRPGLSTFARLLSSAEPHRTRWALQHLPYPVARTIRKFMGPPGRKAGLVARWETQTLRAVWFDLVEEGKITSPWRWEPSP
ncbi:MAG: hypothetical protein U0835_18745 [Isosphaeraceae bacterium]